MNFSDSFFDTGDELININQIVVLSTTPDYKPDGEPYFSCYLSNKTVYKLNLKKYVQLYVKIKEGVSTHSIGGMRTEYIDDKPYYSIIKKNGAEIKCDQETYNLYKNNFSF